MAGPPTAIAADLAPSGTLRASINLGNPVLAQGTPAAPTGVTVDIARELGVRLGVPVALECFDAARSSFEAMIAGRADVCFLAIEPAREVEVAFSAPYVVIEGVFVVPRHSTMTTKAYASGSSTARPTTCTSRARSSMRASCAATRASRCSATSSSRSPPASDSR